MDPQSQTEDPQPPEPPSSPINVSIEDGRWHELVENAHDVVITAAELALNAVEQLDEPYEISVLLTDDTHLQSLNTEFRGMEKPTNVLSFPYEAATVASESSGDGQYLGDLALASGVVAREARDQDKSIHDHLTHLVVHGTLHLLGYDHEDDADCETMESLEIELLARVQIANPYLGAES